MDSEEELSGGTEAALNAFRLAGYQFGQELWYMMAPIGGVFSKLPQGDPDTQAALVAYKAFNQRLMEFKADLGLAYLDHDLLYQRDYEAPYDPVAKINAWRNLGLYAGIDAPGKLQALWRTASVKVNLKEMVYYFLTRAMVDIAFSQTFGRRTKTVPVAQLEHAMTPSRTLSLNMFHHGLPVQLPADYRQSFPKQMAMFHLGRYVGSIGGAISAQAIIGDMRVRMGMAAVLRIELPQAVIVEQ